MPTLYLLIERARRDTLSPPYAKNAHFCCCHHSPFAPRLRQVRNEPKQTKPHKTMQTKLEETLLTLMTICGGLIAAAIVVVPYVLLWKLANAH